MVSQSKLRRQSNRPQERRVRYYREVLSAAVLLVVIFGATWQVLVALETDVRARQRQVLEVILRSTQDAYHYWWENQRRCHRWVAENEDVHRLSAALLDHSREPTTLASYPAQQSLRAKLRPILKDYGVQEVFVIAPDRRSVGATREQHVGTKNIIAQERPELLDRAFAGETILVPTTLSTISTPSLFIAGPLRSSSGKVLAVLALRIDPAKDFTLIARFGRIGHSGETYTIDRRGVMISASRFTDQLRRLGIVGPGQSAMGMVRVADPGGNLLTGFRPSAPLQSRPLTRMAASATAGKTGSSSVAYRDYRGVPVVGAWLWDDKLGFGLATEIDEQEALAPYTKQRNIVVPAASTVGVVGIVLAVVIALVRRRASRKQQQTERSLKQIIDAIPHFIVARDRRGRVLFANQAVTQAYGLNSGGCQSIEQRRFHPEPEEMEQMLADDEQVLTTGLPVFRDNQTFTDTDGRVLKAQVAHLPFQPHGTDEPAVLNLTVDVTELQTLAEDLQRAMEVAEQANRAKSGFLPYIPQISHAVSR